MGDGVVRSCLATDAGEGVSTLTVVATELLVEAGEGALGGLAAAVVWRGPAASVRDCRSPGETISSSSRSKATELDSLLKSDGSSVSLAGSVLSVGSVPRDCVLLHLDVAEVLDVERPVGPDPCQGTLMGP